MREHGLPGAGGRPGAGLEHLLQHPAIACQVGHIRPGGKTEIALKTTLKIPKWVCPKAAFPKNESTSRWIG